MVEPVENNSDSDNNNVDDQGVDDIDEDEEELSLQTIPSHLLSVIASYLNHHEVTKLSMCNFKFNIAMQQHYKMLFLKLTKQQTDMGTSDTPNLQKQASNTNWRKEFAKQHTQKIFSMKYGQLKLDPYAQSLDIDEELSAPILKAIIPNELKQIE